MDRRRLQKPSWPKGRVPNDEELWPICEYWASVLVRQETAVTETGDVAVNLWLTLREAAKRWDPCKGTSPKTYLGFFAMGAVSRSFKRLSVPTVPLDEQTVTFDGIESCMDAVAADELLAPLDDLERKILWMRFVTRESVDDTCKVLGITRYVYSKSLASAKRKLTSSGFQPAGTTSNERQP